MTLSSTITRVSYSGDGTTATFAIPFKFFANDDLSVTLTDINAIATTWTLGTNYTLTGAGQASGGTLTVITSPVDHRPQTGETLTIVRDPDQVQESEFPLGGEILSQRIEDQFDYVTMLIQALEDDAKRSLRIPISETSIGPLPSAGVRASKLFSFDASGDPTVVAGSDSSSTAVTASGSTESRLLADRFAEVYNVKDYGAVGDGVTDDTAAIQAAIDAAEASDNRGILYFPPGDYICTSEINIQASNIHIQGSGAFLSGIEFNVSGTNGLYVGEKTIGGSFPGFTMRDISITANASGSETYLVVLDYPLDGLLEKVRIDGSNGVGLRIGRGQNLTMLAVEVRNSTNDGIIWENQIVGGGGGGQAARLVGCTIKDNAQSSGWGMDVQTHPEMLITGCTIEGNAIRIRSNKNKIIGNSFEFGSGTLLQIGDTSTSDRSAFNFIAGNNFDTTAGVIDFQRYSNCVFLGNSGDANTTITLGADENNSYNMFQGNMGFSLDDMTINSTGGKWQVRDNIGGGTTDLRLTATDGDTTPSVFGVSVLTTANTGSTSITIFDDGYIGQILTVRIEDGNTIIVDGSGIVTGTGGNVSPADGDILVFGCYIGTGAGSAPVWTLISHIPTSATVAASSGTFTIKSGSANSTDSTGWIEYKPGIWVPYTTDPTP